MTHRKVFIIAHNHPDILPGGVEVFAYNLFQALNQEKSHEAFFFSSAVKKPLVNDWTVFYAINENPNEIVICGDDYDQFNHSHLNPEHIYVNFRDFIRLYRPDVVHFQHFLRIGLEAISVIKQTLPETKIVFTFQEYLLICHRDGQMVRTVNHEELCDHASPKRCHNCFPHITEAAFRAREISIKAHLSLVDQFIAPSKFIAHRFIEWGIPPKKIKILDYGYIEVKSAPHRKISKGERRNRFAYFGQINPYKGVLLLIETTRLLLDSGFTDWRLDIFGSLPEESFPSLALAFQQQIAGVQSHVHYYGRYQPQDLAQLIAPIDWVIVPSTGWENSPLVIQEAFIHRRPVITSNISGMAEKVQNEVDGLHFEVNDPLSLAETIKRAGTDSRLWNKLVSNIKPPMTIDECVRRHTKLYDQLLRKN